MRLAILGFHTCAEADYMDEMDDVSLRTILALNLVPQQRRQNSANAEVPPTLVAAESTRVQQKSGRRPVVTLAK